MKERGPLLAGNCCRGKSKTCNFRLRFIKYLNRTDIGEVFSFDFATDGEKQLGLAIVSGLRNQPILILLISKDLGQKWDKKYSITLQDSPYRMSLAMSKQEALVGLVFKQPGDYKIAAVRCGL